METFRGSEFHLVDQVWFTLTSNTNNHTGARLYAKTTRTDISQHLIMNRISYPPPFALAHYADISGLCSCWNGDRQVCITYHRIGSKHIYPSRGMLHHNINTVPDVLALTHARLSLSMTTTHCHLALS